MLHPLPRGFQGVPHPLPRGCLGVLHHLPRGCLGVLQCSTAAPLTLPYYPRERVQHSPPAPPPSPGRGCTIPGTSSIEVAAPPGIPSVRGCRTPGTHFGTLRGVRLCKTTDVLEFQVHLWSSVLWMLEEYYSSKQFLDALASLRSILFSQ